MIFVFHVTPLVLTILDLPPKVQQSVNNAIWIAIRYELKKIRFIIFNFLVFPQ